MSPSPCRRPETSNSPRRRKALNSAAIVTVAAVVRSTAARFPAPRGLGGVAKSAVRASRWRRRLRARRSTAPVSRAAGEAVVRHRSVQRFLCQRLVPGAGDAGPHQPRIVSGNRRRGKGHGRVAMKHSVVSLTINGAERQMLSRRARRWSRCCVKPRAHRHAAWLRPRRLRHLHGDGRRQDDDVLPAAGRYYRGARVETIEGLTPTQGLHPIQEAFLEASPPSAASAPRA